MVCQGPPEDDQIICLEVGKGVGLSFSGHLCPTICALHSQHPQPKLAQVQLKCQQNFFVSGEFDVLDQYQQFRSEMTQKACVPISFDPGQCKNFVANKFNIVEVHVYTGVLVQSSSLSCQCFCLVLAATKVASDSQQTMTFS